MCVFLFRKMDTGPTGFTGSVKNGTSGGHFCVLTSYFVRQERAGQWTFHEFHQFATKNGSNAPAEQLCSI
jgi:hypothetical protein